MIGSESRLVGTRVWTHISPYGGDPHEPWEAFVECLEYGLLKLDPIEEKHRRWGNDPLWLEARYLFSTKGDAHAAYLKACIAAAEEHEKHAAQLRAIVANASEQ